MKKRYFIILSVLLISVFTIFAGCSKTAGSASTSSQDSNSKSYERPGLTGQVTDITGNDITIKVIKMPTFKAGSRPSGSGRGSYSGGNWSSRGGGSRGGASGFSHSGARGLQFTGKTQDVVIPVGVNIVEMSRGQGGASEATVSLSSIQKGSIISFYYASDGKTIDKVSISNFSGRSGSGGSSNGSGN